MDKYNGIQDPPKKVRFEYPNGKKREGKVIKEVREESKGSGGDYVFVIQKIKYESENKKEYVRFGYYRKEEDEENYRWGSQTTFHTDIETTKKILSKAERKEII